MSSTPYKRYSKEFKLEANHWPLTETPDAVREAIEGWVARNFDGASQASRVGFGEWSRTNRLAVIACLTVLRARFE